MMTDFAGYNMDSTTYTMMLLTKIWGLAWSYRDGYLPNKDLRNEGQIRRKITHLPTLFEYMGFVHFASGCIVGPFIEYVDYKNWIELKGHYEKLPTGTYKTLWPAVKRYFTGCCCLTFFLVVSGVFDISIYFCGTPEYVTYKTFFHRVLFYMLAMTSQRFMYYSPWCFSDASMIACGLAFEDVKPDEK